MQAGNGRLDEGGRIAGGCGGGLVLIGCGEADVALRSSGVAALEVMSVTRRIRAVTVQCCAGDGRRFPVLWDVVSRSKRDPGSKNPA